VASCPRCRTRRDAVPSPTSSPTVPKGSSTSAGLILLTNDGDFAQRVAHPSYELDKTYVAEVEGVVQRGTVKQLLAGVTLEDGPVEVSACKVVSSQGKRSIVELVIHEGRNRIVRRLLDEVGHPVRRLTRTAIGPVQLLGLRSGELRELTTEELGVMLDAAKL
jgi:23S rRNA pseudouridine2605 synthase